MTTTAPTCARSACKASGANFWNLSTRSWYCPACAAAINLGHFSLCISRDDLPVEWAVPIDLALQMDAEFEATQTQEERADTEAWAMFALDMAKRGGSRKVFAEIEAQAAKLQAFKDFVHKTLDAMGVPAELPESEHTKAGCRIGGRLEWVAQQLRPTPLAVPQALSPDMLQSLADLVQESCALDAMTPEQLVDAALEASENLPLGGRLYNVLEQMMDRIDPTWDARRAPQGADS
jgi:hypothetical protein